MSEKKAETPVTAEQTKQVPRCIIVQGDKGGVGKSFVARALADYLRNKEEKLLIIDSDTSNPDVSRMFESHLPCKLADLDNGDGWMDVIDYIVGYKDHTIIINTPGGIGKHMKKHIKLLVDYLSKQNIPLELWWTLSLNHDAVNLLENAYKEYGHHFAKLRVVCNLHFSDGNHAPYCLWEGPFRSNIENAGGMTIWFPGLHIRVVNKLFNPANVIPFSVAVDASLGEAVGLTTSEQYKLMGWCEEIAICFAPAFSHSIHK